MTLPSLRTRRHLLTAATTLPLMLTLAGLLPRPARAAGPSADAVRFDNLYIPALFLTGSAGKSPEAAAQAVEAMARLRSHWPALRDRLATQAPADRQWQRTLAEVGGHIDAAGRQVGNAAWAPAHETLEHIRQAFFTARRARGEAYLLDDFTAFHDAMEKLANAGPAGREALAPAFAQARALWRPLESARIDASEWGLSPAREARLRRGLADEGAALARLSDALRDGNEAALAAAAAAIKGPFIQAYTAFGWPAGETPAPAH